MSSAEMVFRAPCDFSYSYRDINDNPFPSHILQVFQDAAGIHADRLGVGYGSLKGHNLIWVLVKVRYQVLRPLPLSGLSVVTWPQPKTLIEFNREYLITDDEGTEYVRGTSKWCVIDINTRRLIRAEQVRYPSDEYCRDVNFADPYVILKPFDFSKMTPVLSHKVLFADLDHNRHMNNTGYAVLCLNAIPGMLSRRVDDMQINFLSECGMGDEIDVYVMKDGEESYQVMGVRKDGAVSFHARLSLSLL